MNKHSLANYPLSFKGTVISPTKICLQFQDVQVKFRKNLNSSEYLKMPNGDVSIPIATTGTEVATCNMGCQMPVLEDLQFALINSYVSYAKYNSEVYKEHYGKEFIDFLLQVQAELANALIQIRGFTDD
jgi:hypothetical protein